MSLYPADLRMREMVDWLGSGCHVILLSDYQCAVYVVTPTVSSEMRRTSSSLNDGVSGGSIVNIADRMKTQDSRNC
jgi:hypothetical protein